MSRTKARLASLRVVPQKEREILAYNGQADLAMVFGLHLEPVECFWIVGHDQVGNIHTIIEVARGKHAEVDVDIASALTGVLSTGANLFSVIHNHPTRSALPSESDRTLTNILVEAANTVGLLLEDHVIVEPGGDSFSFRKAGMITGRRRPKTRAAAQEDR